MDEWFKLRRGLAYGIMWAGTGVSGVIIPFVMDRGLNEYGSATMLRAWTVTLAVLAAPLLIFVKGRVPLTQATYPSHLNYRFLKSPLFVSFTFHLPANAVYLITLCGP